MGGNRPRQLIYILNSIMDRKKFKESLIIQAAINLPSLHVSLATAEMVMENNRKNLRRDMHGWLQ